MCFSGTREKKLRLDVLFSSCHCMLTSLWTFRLLSLSLIFILSLRSVHRCVILFTTRCKTDAEDDCLWLQHINFRHETKEEKKINLKQRLYTFLWRSAANVQQVWAESLAWLQIFKRRVRVAHVLSYCVWLSSYYYGLFECCLLKESNRPKTLCSVTSFKKNKKK